MRSCDCGCGGTCEDERRSVSRSSDGGGKASGGSHSPSSSALGGVNATIAGGGRPLDRRTRRRMERSFGRDFSGVRIHDHAAGHRSARDLHATAYTVGDHIVFGAGRFSPDSREGTRLLAHELTHTVQQRDGRHVQQSGTVSSPGDRHEREAERVADVVSAGGIAPVVGSLVTPGAVHRDLLDDALDWAGETAGGAADAVGGAASDAWDWTSDKAGQVAESTGEVVGDVTDAAVDGIRSVYELAQGLAAALGGSFSVSGCGIRVTTPSIVVPSSLVIEVPLPEAALSVPFAVGIIPISGLVNAYGALYLNISAIPSLKVQLGPVAIHPASFLIDWCAPTFAATAGVTYTVAAALGSEIRGGVGGEVGLEVNVPVGPVIVPIPIPLASIDAGLVGAVKGTGVQNVTEQIGLGYSGGRFSVVGAKSVDAGFVLAAGVGAFGSLTVLGMNLCTLYWPFWKRAWSQTWSVDSGYALGVDPSGFDFTFGQVAVSPGRVDFDQFALDLDTDVLTDDCPPLDRLCRILYALGMMPSQNGGTWDNYTPPQWGGLRPDIYARDPGFASGAKCRGACGPDCETCEEIGDIYECEHLGAYHGWQLYPNATVCPTHVGCRNHDGCYDWCGSGGPSGLGPWACRRMCDLECACNHPVSSCVGWIFGLGGDGLMTFSDPPISLPGCEGPCPNQSIGGAGGALHRLCLPRVDLSGRLERSMTHRDQTDKHELWSKPIPIYGPLFAMAIVWAQGRLRLTGTAGIGPVYLDNVCVDVDPATHRYSGFGELHVPADLGGSLALTGTLGADLNLECLFTAARAEGGLEGTASAGMSTEFVDRVTVGCNEGELDIVNDAWFDTILDLAFLLRAFVRLKLLGFEVYSKNWNLAAGDWERQWRHEIKILRQTGANAGIVDLNFVPASMGIVQLLDWLLPSGGGTQNPPDDSVVGWLLKLCNPTDDDPEAETCNDAQTPCGSPTLPLTEVRWWTSPDRGEHMRAQPLTRCPPSSGGGSMPDQSIFGDVWRQCIRKPRPGDPQGDPAGQSGRWVRAHLLHGPTSSSPDEHLNGPGDNAQNLILTDKSINGTMRTRFEQLAIHRIHKEHCVLWYQVDVEHFADSGYRRFFGEEVTVSWGDYNPITGTTSTIESDTIESTREPPACPNFQPGQ